MGSFLINLLPLPMFSQNLLFTNYLLIFITTISPFLPRDKNIRNQLHTPTRYLHEKSVGNFDFSPKRFSSVSTVRRREKNKKKVSAAGVFKVIPRLEWVNRRTLASKPKATGRNLE